MPRRRVAIGQLTTMSCPLCAGMLAQFVSNFPPLFRCESGHVYTGAALGLTGTINSPALSAVASIEEWSVLANARPSADTKPVTSSAPGQTGGQPF